MYYEMTEKTVKDNNIPALVLLNPNGSPLNRPPVIGRKIKY
jgi:hypothetical protein